MAADFFLKLEGIDGESIDAEKKDHIELVSWSWGVSQSGTAHGFGGGGAGAGKASAQDFTFNMYMNKASPDLMLICATGKHIPTGELFCRKAGDGQKEFLVIKFTDLMVSAYSTGGQDGAGIPVESISLNFAKVEFDYKPQKEDGTMGGSVKRGYNFAKNEKV